MDNRVNAELTADNQTNIENALNTIQQELPFLLELSPAESKRITRMEAGRVDFVRKALLIANANPNLRPQFFEIGELEKDVNLCQQLDIIISKLDKVRKLASDTRDQAGHEAYSSSREVYQTAKRAAAQGIPGAQNAYEELRHMFEGQGKTTKPDDETKHD